MKIITLFCFLLFMVSGISMYAQSTNMGSIKGQIVEKESSEPLEFITVILYNASDSTLKKGTITDNKGTYTISGLKNGNYYIKLNCMGFEDLTISDISIDKRRSTIDLGIKEISYSRVLLSDVSVVSEKNVQLNSIDRKVYNVDKDILSQTGSVSDILQNIPSVSVDVDGTVSLRGATNITFLINGKPSTLLNKNSAMVLQQIPSSNIERIEVITNPSAKFKPDGIGGMINIVLKKEKKQGFNGIFLANAGNDKRYNTSVSANYNTGKVNIYGNYAFRQDNSPRTSTDYRISRDSLMNVINYYNSYSVAASHPYSNMGTLGMEYQINDNNKFEMAGNAYRQDKYRTENTSVTWEDSNELITSEYTVDRINEETEMEWETNLLFEHLFKKEDHALLFELNVSGYDELEDNHYTEIYSLPSEQENLSRVLISKGGPKLEFYTEYTLPINEDTELEAGYELLVFRDNLIYLGENYDNTSKEWLKDLEKSNDFVLDQQVHAFYSTFAHSFDNFSFLAGLRAEQVFTSSYLITLDSTVPNNYFKIYPTLHLSYELNANQELQLNYSKRVNRPDSDEMNPFPEYSDPRNMESGNPLAKPEQIHSLELGYHLKKQDFNFIPSIYYRYKYDAFSEIKKYVNDTVLLRTFDNLSSSQAAGAEFIMSANIHNIVSLNLSLNGYYSAIDASNIGYSEKKETFSWDSKLGVNVNITKSTLFQLYTYYRSTRIKAQGTEDPSFRVNFGLRQDVWKNKASIILTVSDVFNTYTKVSYIDTAELYQKSVKKRNAQVIYLGFSYRFGQSIKKQSQELKFDDSI